MYKLTRESICSFVPSLYIDFDNFGYCTGLPIVELDVCYTSTNLLAKYMLRSICGRNDVANKIKAFLDKYY